MNIQSATLSPLSQPQGDAYGGTGIQDSITGNPKTVPRKNDQGVIEHQVNSQSETQAPENNSNQEKPTSGIDSSQLTPEQLRLVEELKQIDTKVRNHELAHITAGGSYITSAANFTYKKGPDGKDYAVGGEVGIDVTPVPGDPEATIRKMRQVRQAALAPGDPSPQDRKVAANAASQSVKALSDLTMLRAKEQSAQRENQAFGITPKEATDAYTRVNTLPETETSTFQLAV